MAPLDPAPYLPRSVRDAWSWLLLALGGYFGGQVLSTVVVVVVGISIGEGAHLSSALRSSIPPAWVVVSGLGGLWAGFAAAILIASRTRGTGSVAADMGLRFSTWDPLVGLGIGVAGQVLLVPLLYLPLQPLIPHLDRRLGGPAQRLTGGFHGADLAVIGVLTVVVVPVVEELFFRGLLLRSLLRLTNGAGRVLGPVLAVVATGVLFGLAHAETLQLLGLAAFGIVLSALAYRTRRLGPGIFAHGAFNLVAVLALAARSASR